MLNSFYFAMVHGASDLTPFVGRQAELAHIHTLLADPTCRLLTLVGPGGMGKTRLAAEAAQKFSGNACFVPLQPLTSPVFLVPALAAALGFQFDSGNDAKQQLLSYLHDNTRLLVLDNFEHLLDGVILVSEILASAPDVRLLITSRERLNVREEWVLEVGGLEYPSSAHDAEPQRYSAVELFVQHARRSKASFQLDDLHFASVMHICRRLGGMPLGIELAASWVQALSCEAIADEIERSLDILETPARNVEPRHRTMRAAIDQSWRLLSDGERAVFRKLSVFRGGFTRDAGAVVANASLRTLRALVDKSMVRVDVSGRYELHELLRQYAEEQLNLSSEAEAVRNAYSAYYAHFLQRMWQPLRNHEQVQALDEIQMEFENVRGAWQTMVVKRKTADLSRSVYSVWYFAHLRGRYPEALTLFKQAEEGLRPMVGDRDVDRVVGQLLTRQAWFYADLGQLEAGRALANEGLSLLQRAGSPEDVALAWYSLCNVAAPALEWQAVNRFGEQMAQIARHMDDRWLLACAHFSLSNAALYTGALEEARQLDQEGLALADACGDSFLMAVLRATRAAIAQSIGDYAVVDKMLAQTLKLHEALGHAGTIGDLHREIGINAFRVNDYARAGAHYQRALESLADLGSFQLFLFSTLRDVAQLWVALGRRERAVEVLTFILDHPKPLPYHREAAEQMLRPLRTELRPQAFAAAQERASRLEFSGLVHELIVELGQLSQALGQQVPVSSASLLADPLSERELDVLRQIAEGCSNQEIAVRLYVGISTVKKHINHIFDKLDVNNRTQAVARARARGLLH